MIALVLRGMAQRRLRSVLTAIAVVLGVAMIAGTYVLTDQIRNAFDDIQRSANEGVDAAVTPREAFRGSFSQPRPLDAALVDRVRRVPGVERAEGQVERTGSLVIRGDVLETTGAPQLVLSTLPEPFDPTTPIQGRDPARTGEIAVDQQVAEREKLRVGDRLGLATRDGLKRVRLVGVFRYGEGESIGGATLVTLPLADAQRWFDRRGQVSTIVASSAPGVSPAQLARRLRAVLPSDQVKVRTGEQNAAEQADEISDQIGGFLTPALLAFAGAALLVGAFIIFNTFSITVAQRTHEFALLRTLGATRRQVLAAVAGEALLLGVVSSGLGLLAGIGFAKALNALFDAVGFGLPTSEIVLKPRTVVLALVVGIGVTLVSALAPAIRATRVAPVAALREEGAGARPERRRRFAPWVAVLVSVGGVGLLALGVFGGGPASSRLATMAAGVVLVFVGVALTARHLVRPLASAIGWPLERSGRTAGRLARENAMRNPARTAVTSAALMVGLGLVVFVAVFAEGLKDSISSSITRLIKADVIVNTENFEPMPARAETAVRKLPTVAATTPVLIDQLRVPRQPKNAIVDFVTGVDPATLRRTYVVEWLAGGSDALLDRLRGNAALVEEQFAKAHRVSPGGRFRVVTPSGGRATLTAIGEYRDPQLIQGLMVDRRTFARLSPSDDPFLILVAKRPSASGAAVRRDVTRAVRPFPIAKVTSNTGLRESVERQTDQLVYLLYVLLAMSVVISLFGIANSLVLSIHERTREFGLLRAVGATRTQIRRVVRYESVITAVIGGLLGTVVGLVFAFIVTQALDDLGLGFSVPPGQLVAFLGAAVLVGFVAALLPAWRGARLDVLEALRYE
jgi:putative ABC transport system permease protein